MQKENKALKEWAVVVKALDEGKQLLLFRKGGIREEEREFRLRHTEFFLYPTYEHQDPCSLQESFHQDFYEAQKNHIAEDKVVISNWARVEEVFEAESLEQLHSLANEYIWSPRYVEQRYNWRKDKPLQVLLLRVYRLPNATTLDVIPEYRGCKSWVELEAEIPAADSRAVISDANFEQRAERIRSVFSS